MKTAILTTVIAASVLFAAPSALAAGYGTNGYGSPCQPIYGGGVNCATANISLNKTVKNPQTKEFVNNLGVNDAKYAPDQEVTFKIAVTNTGDATLSNVKVTDNFPQYITFVSGNGTYDKNTRAFTFTVDSVKAGETKSYEIKAKLAKNTDLPKDTGVFCLVNQAVTINNDQTVTDNAQFCIENQTVTTATVPTTKGGIPVYPTSPSVKTTPATGAESLMLMALAPLSGLGVFLRRKTK